MVWDFLISPQFIGVWGGIAVELGGTVCLLGVIKRTTNPSACFFPERDTQPWG